MRPRASVSGGPSLTLRASLRSWALLPRSWHVRDISHFVFFYKADESRIFRYCLQGEYDPSLLTQDKFESMSGCCIVHDSRARDGTCERRDPVELSLPVS